MKFHLEGEGDDFSPWAACSSSISMLHTKSYVFWQLFYGILWEKLSWKWDSFSKLEYILNFIYWVSSVSMLDTTKR